MKVFALLCLIGIAAASSSSGVAELSWESGQTYQFKYQGRMLTGIPELSTHYSGMGIQCNVELQVISPTKFAMQVKEASYTRINEVLSSSGSGSRNWRDLVLPSLAPVPAQSASVLSMTSMFELQEGGEARNIVLSEQEPNWSVNFKKALVGLFVTKTAPNRGQVETNTINGKSAGQYPMAWTVSEDSLDGTCEAIYQLVEIPTYIAKSMPKTGAPIKMCSNGPTYELTKTRDISSCTKRSTFMNYKPGFFSCPLGNCDGQTSRSSITRYIACGSPNNLQITTIVNEGEFFLDLMGFKTEKVLSGTQQTLTMVNKSKTSQVFPNPPQPKTYPTLRYVYSSDEIPEGGKSVEGGLEKGILSGLDMDKPSILRTMPKHMLSTPSGSQGGSTTPSGPEDVPAQIENYIQQLVTDDLKTAVNIAQKQIPIKVLTIARGLTVLTKEQIKALYEKMDQQFSSNEEDKTTFRNVMFDCLVISGAKNPLSFLNDLINAGVLSSVQASSVFMFMPQYIITPTEKLLDNLFKTVKSSWVAKSPVVYSHAVLGFSSLIQKACLAENRKTSYPTFIYGEFCNQDSSIVQQWVSYLKEQLQQASSSQDFEKVNLAIVSLGVMAHKSVIPTLLPYVEAGTEQYNKETGLTRFLAVSALGTVGVRYPETVAPLALSVFGNMGETTEVRVAAFNVLMRMNPHTAVLQKIASMTWYETNVEVLKVVNTAFLTISNTKNMAPANKNLYSLQKKISIIYPTIKRVNGEFPTSAAIFSSDYLNELGVGYYGVRSWLSSSSSMMPHNVYVKLVYFLDSYQYTPLVLDVRQNGIDKVISTISKLIRDPSQTKSQFQEHIKQKLSGQWRETIEKLNIKTRGGSSGSESSISGSIFMQLFEDNTLFYNMDSISEEFIREKVTPFMNNPSELKKKLGGEKTVNFQKLMDFGPSEFMVPSEMGMPLVIETHLPVVISLKGKTNLETKASIPSFNMQVKSVLAAQYTGWVGTVCPFTNESVLIGIDEHSVLNLPGQISIDFSTESQQMKVNLQPLTVTQPIDIFHYHVRPFGVYQDFWDLTPFTQARNTKKINAPTPTQTHRNPVGDYLGLNLEAIVNTQSPYPTTKSGFMQKFAMYNYSFMNMIRFFWTSSALSETNKPSIRMHEFEIRFDPNQSGTKEIDILFKVGYASKSSGQPIKYHKIKVDEQKKSVSSLPYMIKSEPLSDVARSNGPHSERSVKIQKVLEGLNIESGSGFSLIYSLTMKGSRSRTWTYSLNTASGNQGLSQKWNIQTESEQSQKKVCFSGSATLPTMPVWKIEEIRAANAQFSLNSVLGFGSTCQESQIVVSTSSQVSQKQKELSRTSSESEELRRQKASGVSHVELSELAEQVRSQASLRDEIKVTVQFKKVPKEILEGSEAVVTFFKGYWWRFMTLSTGSASFDNNSQTMNLDLNLDSTVNAVNVTMTRPGEKVRFTDVPLPYSFCWIMGWTSNVRSSSSSHSAMKSMSQVHHPLVSAGRSLRSKMTGGSRTPIIEGSTKCSIEGDTLTTVSKNTIKLSTMDDCFYLLSADCSEQKSYGLLIRATGPSAEESKEIKLFMGKTILLLTPSSETGKSPSPVKVTIDGTVVSIGKGASHIVQDEKKSQIMKITQTPDEVIMVESPKVTFLFDGVKVQIQATAEEKKSCGICGKHAHSAKEALEGPNKCLYSKPELLAASYRTGKTAGGKACKPLPAQIKKELKEQKAACPKAKVIPSKVVSTYESSSGACIHYQNEIITKPTSICFSRYPVTSCGKSCKGAGKEVSKTVTYTCLAKENKTAKLMSEKIRSGKTVPELKSYPISFQSARQLPTHCVPA